MSLQLFTQNSNSGTNWRLQTVLKRLLRGPQILLKAPESKALKSIQSGCLQRGHQVALFFPHTLIILWVANNNTEHLLSLTRMNHTLYESHPVAYLKCYVIYNDIFKWGEKGGWVVMVT